MADTSYQGYKARPELLPITRARVDPSKPSDYFLQLNGDAPAPAVEASAAVPFNGIRTDGRVMGNLALRARAAALAGSRRLPACIMVGTDGSLAPDGRWRY